MLTSFKFKGDTTVSTIGGGFTPFPVTAQGGNYAFIPAMYYALPISDRIAVGFGSMCRLVQKKIQIMATQPCCATHQPKLLSLSLI